MCRTPYCAASVSEEVVWSRCIGLLVGIETEYPGLPTRYWSKIEVEGGGELWCCLLYTSDAADE